VTALLLAAVGRPRRETGVALSADHLLAVVLGGKGLERWLDDTTTQTEDQVESRLLHCEISSVSNSLSNVFRESNNSSDRSHPFRHWGTDFAHLLDVVVAQSAAVLELLSGEDQTLLVWGNSLLVLDLALDIVDGVAGLDLKGDGLAREGLNEAEGAKC